MTPKPWETCLGIVIFHAYCCPRCCNEHNLTCHRLAICQRQCPRGESHTEIGSGARSGDTPNDCYGPVFRCCCAASLVCIAAKRKRGQVAVSVSGQWAPTDRDGTSRKGAMRSWQWAWRWAESSPCLLAIALCSQAGLSRVKQEGQ